MYGILSKGIHELSEEECLASYDVVHIGIELILDEKQAKKEQEEKAAAARAKIEKLLSGNIANQKT